MCVIRPGMNEFHLERVEEGLRYRVIPTIPFPAHTALNTRGFP